MGNRQLLRARLVALAVIAALGGCERPGPLSAAARGRLPPPPAAPAWSAALAGRPLKAAFPATAACVGAVDGYADRYKGARDARGWAWNSGGRRPVQHLAAVDAAGRMVGFGEGGDPRPDVPAARPDVASPSTGWRLLTPTAERRYVAYGLDESARSACVIGELSP